MQHLKLIFCSLKYLKKKQETVDGKNERGK